MLYVGYLFSLNIAGEESSSQFCEACKRTSHLGLAPAIVPVLELLLSVPSTSLDRLKSVRRDSIENETVGTYRVVVSTF